MYCKDNGPRFVPNRQETAAKFTSVNRDQHAVPLWSHISAVENRWQCNVTTASNRRSKHGNFEKTDGKEFWNSKLSQPLKIRYQKNDNVEYVVFSWMMSKKEYFPLFFFSTCFSAFWSQCIHDAPPTQSNLSITPFPPWPEHGFSMATLSPIIMVQWKITTNWKSNYWCWGSFYHSPMMFGM